MSTSKHYKERHYKSFGFGFEHIDFWRWRPMFSSCHLMVKDTGYCKFHKLPCVLNIAIGLYPNKICLHLKDVLYRLGKPTSWCPLSKITEISLSLFWYILSVTRGKCVKTILHLQVTNSLDRKQVHWFEKLSVEAEGSQRHPKHALSLVKDAEEMGGIRSLGTATNSIARRRWLTRPCPRISEIQTSAWTTHSAGYIFDDDSSLIHCVCFDSPVQRGNLENKSDSNETVSSTWRQ